MTDAATPKAAKKKASKPRKPSDHPKYSDMIKQAIVALKERGGSSRQAILKYIMKHFKVADERSANAHLKMALKAGVSKGSLKQAKGTGASGSFKVVTVKPEKKTKLVTPKKPKAKKPKKVKKPKKPAAKKVKKTSPKKVAKPKKAATPKKAAKPKSKPATPKKTAKPTVQKASPKKKAAKPKAAKPKVKKSSPKKKAAKK